MQDPFQDRTIILALAATLVIVFGLIFSVKPNYKNVQPSIQWRDIPGESPSSLKL